MTRNQHHALDLARNILRGALSAQALTDQEWHLMLLAAGTNCFAAPPKKVSIGVLRNARGGRGYYAGALTPSRRTIRQAEAA
ncbi:MAG TPA: hypothetical protein VH475_13330 [Tepidisphaeraceae bacterium]|jgi:hypothetical protein